MFVFICASHLMRSYPTNYIILSIFTLAESLLVGAISATYSADQVVLAVGVTAAVVIALTIYAFQTKYDFTGLGPYLFVACIVMLVFGLFVAISGSKAFSRVK